MKRPALLVLLPLGLLLGPTLMANAFLQQRSSPLTTTRRAASGSSRSRLVSMKAADWALLFDCDGVLADTERDGHRPAFNLAFERKGITCDWTVPLYGELLKIGGGKERMTAHWNKVGWPSGYEGEEARKALVQELHLLKTQLFMDTIEAGKVPLRPGVLRVVDAAIQAGVPLAVCSTSNEKAVSTLVRVLMGPERAAKFQIFAGDVVKKKKPSPDIYLLAKDTLGLDPTRTLVIEDSEIGLAAAKAAGMKCVVTKSSYTKEEDFAKADRVLDELGDGPGGIVFEELVALAHS